MKKFWISQLKSMQLYFTHQLVPKNDEPRPWGGPQGCAKCAKCVKTAKIGKNDVYRIEAQVFGEDIDITKHEFKVEIKSPTFHEMDIQQGKEIKLRYLLDL